MDLTIIIILGIGGMFGAVLRIGFIESKILKKIFQEHAFFLNFFINNLGCFIMGLFYHSFISTQLIIDYFICGLISGFTTFSGFIHDYHILKEQNQTLGILLITSSISFGILSFYLGLFISLFTHPLIQFY